VFEVNVPRPPPFVPVPLWLAEYGRAVMPESGPDAPDVGELHAVAELRELADLLAAVWGRAGEPPLSHETLRALSHAGAYVAGVRRDGGLVGGLVGFLGRDPDGTPTLHSHVLGVLEGARAAGVGYALKQHQRRWALDREIGTVTWTFDPLVRRNARFNLVRLGAEASAYHPDFYGEMDDALNAGDPTDRLVVRWRVAAPRRQGLARGLRRRQATGPHPEGPGRSYRPNGLAQLRASAPARAGRARPGGVPGLRQRAAAGQAGGDGASQDPGGDRGPGGGRGHPASGGPARHRAGRPADRAGALRDGRARRARLHAVPRRSCVRRAA